jgi:hypothetical protein
MYSMRELCELYNVSYKTLRKYLVATGVFAKDERCASLIGYMRLMPFFKVYGDRTQDPGRPAISGLHGLTAGQLVLFAR